MVVDSDHREITVFTDTIWEKEAEWLFLGSLFVDTRFLEDVFNAVLNARYDCEGWETARADEVWTAHHTENDAVISFDQANDPRCYEIATRWLSLIRQHSTVTNQMKLKLTGINLDLLDAELHNPYDAVYDHVLHEHLIDARTQFFGESVQVDYRQLYCPDRDQTNTTAFTAALENITDPLTGIGTVNPINIGTLHQGTASWKQGQVLQVTNLVTGAAAHLFTTTHLPHRKAKLSWKLNELIQKSMSYEQPAVDRCSLSFYPKNGGNKEENTFYYWHPITRNDPHRNTLEQFL